MKSIAWSLVRNSGLLGLWRRRHRRCIPILTAHGVASDTQRSAWTPLWSRHDVDQLDSALRVLCQYYDFISLDEAVDILNGDRSPRDYAMVLTFDDGYLNNYSVALPVLESLKIPATFFVCPGMMESGKRFWIDRLDYAIQHLPEDARSIDIAGHRFHLHADSRVSLAAEYQRLRRALKSNFTEDFDEEVDRLALDLEKRAGCSLLETESDDVWSGIMNWTQAKDAQSRNIQIGSHTTDHVRLTLVNDDKVDSQLQKSKQQISSQLNTTCTSIAYPNGDHSELVRARTRDARYKCGLTCDPGVNEVGDDLFALKRINFPSDTSADKILGIASGFRNAVANFGL